MTEHRVIIYERIKELKAEIDRYMEYMEADKINERYYKEKIRDLETLKNYNECLYYETWNLQ